MDRTATVHLLGRAALVLPDGSILALRQPAYAAVALLHLDFGGRAKRATLAGRLWEDVSAVKALNNLRQTLLRTRERLSRHEVELFRSDNVHIALSPTIRLDLEELEGLRTVSTLEEFQRLIGLCNGSLLDAFDRTGPQFQLWLDAQRALCETHFVDLALGAADRIGGVAGRSALQLLVEQLPLSEAATLGLVRMHSSLGEQTAATAAITAFRQRIAARGTEPSPELLSALKATSAPPSQASVMAAAAPEQVQDKPTPLFDRARPQPRIVLLPPLQPDDIGDLPRHMAPALVEDVTIRLSRLRSISIIAPFSAWQLDPLKLSDEVRTFKLDYLVESNVVPDPAGDGSSLLVRLLRSSDRQLIWSDRLPLSAASAPERYWDLVDAVTTALADNIEAAELRRSRQTVDPAAYAHFLAGRHRLRSFDLDELRIGRTALQMARDIEPNRAGIESALARSFVYEWVLRPGVDPTLVSSARRHAERAVALDPADGSGYRELGLVSLYEHRLEESLSHLARAAELAPHHADILADYADALTHNSDFDGAEKLLAAAMELNPIPPDEYLWTLGAIHYFRGRFRLALNALQQTRSPDAALRLLAASAAMSDEPALARRYRDRVLALQPDFTLANWSARLPQRDPADVALYIEGLRKAGFT